MARGSVKPAGTTDAGRYTFVLRWDTAAPDGVVAPCLRVGWGLTRMAASCLSVSPQNWGVEGATAALLPAFR